MSKFVLKSWWLHFTDQDFNTIFDRQKLAASLSGACGQPVGKSPQNDPSVERITYEILPVWRDPFWKFRKGKIIAYVFFSEWVPKSRNFSDPYYLWIFAQKRNTWPLCLLKKISQKNRDTVEICKINFFRGMSRGWDK